MKNFSELQHGESVFRVQVDWMNQDVYFDSLVVDSNENNTIKFLGCTNVLKYAKDEYDWAKRGMFTYYYTNYMVAKGRAKQAFNEQIQHAKEMIHRYNQELMNWEANQQNFNKID